MADYDVIQRNGAPALVPRLTAAVPLGRWEVTSGATLTADNVFDASLYSHYTITGAFRPATNAANLTMFLRTATPSNVAGGFTLSQSYVLLNGGRTGGQSGTDNVLAGSLGNTAFHGVEGMDMRLIMGSSGSRRHTYFAQLISGQSTFARYWLTTGGEFQDDVPRQGIRFNFSSGNIAEGWFEIVGHKKQ